MTFIHEDVQVVVPNWVTSIDAFRRWVDADDFPEKGRIWWLKGELWIDLSREQIFSHVLVKTEFTAVVASLVQTDESGLFLTDGLFLSNIAADIAGKPDSTYIATATLQSDRVRLIEGAEGGFVELQGSPDMVLEVLSASSVKKDTVVLKQAYWDADIREYWLVDARGEPLQFDIFRHTARGYAAQRKQDGWIKSPVFGKSFKLTQRIGPAGHPDYTLAVR